MKKATLKLISTVRRNLPALVTLGTNQYALVEAKRKYAELMAEGQARYDSKLLETGRARFDFLTGELIDNSSSREPPAPDPDRLIEYARAQETIRHAENLAATIQEAAEQAEATDDSKTSEAELDEDWLFRWRDHAQRVSDKTMRALWAKLLVGEIQNPTAVSLRTMDFVSNISAAEAALISKVASLVIDDGLLFGNKSVLEHYGLGFMDLMALNELGILNFGDGLGLEKTLDSDVNKRTGIYCHSHGVIFTTPNAGDKVKYPVIKLTSLGKQLLGLADEQQANLDYLREIAGALCVNGCTGILAVLTKRDGAFFMEKIIEIFPKTVAPTG
jgi:hypothetical protein